MEIPIFKEIVVIFALSVAVLLLCHRFRMPTVVGFLLTGVLCGPHGLGLVSAVGDVENLATIGVVLLLFTVGMEFSIKNIIRYRYYFFGGGMLQVFGTLLTTLFIAKLCGLSWAVSLFAGFLMTLSSTAIVLRVLEERSESEKPQGRLTLGILIFQDVVAVPMMLLVPVIAGTGEEFDLEHLYRFLMGIGMLLVMSIIAFRAIPKLLYYVTQTRSRELFLLSILTICFAVAWVTSSIGLSLSLGAFLAGLVVSESEYSDEAVGNILPFQEIFTSFFFVSMGMLLDVGFALQQPHLILGLAFLVLLLKTCIAGGSALILGLPLSSALLTGVALSQIGEFSFIIAHTGSTVGLLSDYGYQVFLAVSLLTMGMTPYLMGFSHQITAWLSKKTLPGRLIGGRDYTLGNDKAHDSLEGHIIIVGFGLRGQHLARAAKAAGLPYIILELDSDVVRDARSRGEPIRYGDPSHSTVLIHAGIKKAKTVAVLIKDSASSMRIVNTAKTLNPDVYVIARTRYFIDVQRLFKIGADDVVPDEFGSSLEIFTRVLQKAHVPHGRLIQCVNEIRSEGYELLRLHNEALESASAFSLDPSEARIETIFLPQESPLVGKTVLESGLKKNYGLTVLLIRREGKTMTSVAADTILQESDSIIVIGTPDDLQKAKQSIQTCEILPPSSSFAPA
ncbi:MAG: cation:proton antiporter [Parachlamydiaceae bacterium]